MTLIACLQRWYTTVVNRNKTEAQNSKQNHKTQNRITKPKTESQNSKQNHKTQSRITKLKTETQNSKLVRWLQVCYNQLQKYLRHCTIFCHKWPVHDLVLVIPLLPLIKVASNTRPYSKLGGTTLNGRREVSIISHRAMTRSDLK